ncbi:hypothetical protein, partial [Klebsiella pneumoniae]|uniref:hypothetical protein n=1 Tax=Klebsiella pneumoniae TaxID=573 RepID=UPI001D0EFCBA
SVIGISLTFGNPHYCSGPHSPTTIDNGAIPHVHLNSAHRELSSKSQFKLINYSSYVLRPLLSVAFLLFQFAK